MALDSEILISPVVGDRLAEVVVEPALHGSVLVLIQFDVCEEIRLDELRQIFGARTLEQPSFKHPAPGIRALSAATGGRADRAHWCSKVASGCEGQIKYYDYGVLSVVFELPFSGDWDTLVRTGQPLGLGRGL